jgi:hypothetical protein
MYERYSHILEIKEGVATTVDLEVDHPNAPTKRKGRCAIQRTSGQSLTFCPGAFREGKCLQMAAGVPASGDPHANVTAFRSGGSRRFTPLVFEGLNTGSAWCA